MIRQNYDRFSIWCTLSRCKTKPPCNHPLGELSIHKNMFWKPKPKRWLSSHPIRLVAQPCRIRHAVSLPHLVEPFQSGCSGGRHTSCSPLSSFGHAGPPSCSALDIKFLEGNCQFGLQFMQVQSLRPFECILFNIIKHTSAMKTPEGYNVSS